MYVGYRVTLGVDAETLGDLTARPHLGDAIVHAVAAGFGATPHASMQQLRFVWSGVVLVEHAFRGAVSVEAADIVAASDVLLRAIGGPVGAVRAVSLDARRNARVELTRSLEPADRRKVEEAIRALLVDAEEHVPHVTIA
jgi:hypothetical protein